SESVSRAKNRVAAKFDGAGCSFDVGSRSACDRDESNGRGEGKRSVGAADSGADAACRRLARALRWAGGENFGGASVFACDERKSALWNARGTFAESGGTRALSARCWISSIEL